MIEDLRKMKLFGGLSDNELKLLEKITNQSDYQPGETIFSEGVKGDKLYIIKEGKVRITQKVESGETQPLAILSVGNFFGEISFLDSKPHSANASAMRKTTVISISRKDFDKLAKNNPQEGYTILHRVSEQVCKLLRQMDEKFIDMVKFVWEFGAKS
jgi:CRP-like cAMP-binding protein